MDSYEVRWKTSAEKDLLSIAAEQIPRIIEAVERLKDNPFPAQCRKLRGSERDYRIRVGDYRVVYRVDTEMRKVTIYHVRHRGQAYRRG